MSRITWAPLLIVCTLLSIPVATFGAACRICQIKNGCFYCKASSMGYNCSVDACDSCYVNPDFGCERGALTGHLENCEYSLRDELRFEHTSDSISEGPSFFLVDQVGAPASFSEVRFGLKRDLLLSARIRNDGHLSIDAYRIGWVTVGAAINSTKWFRSGLVHQAVGIGNTVNVLPPGASPGLLTPKTVGVAFFIDEVRFSNGESWKAKEDDVRRSIRRQLGEQLPLASLRIPEPLPHSRTGGASIGAGLARDIPSALK